MPGSAPFSPLENPQVQRRTRSHLEVKEATHGTRRIETPLLKSWAIPIPRLPEQKEIVRRVDDLFALVDEIEARYKKAKAHVDKLTQSILAKAFRGELVPQEPHG